MKMKKLLGGLLAGALLLTGVPLMDTSGVIARAEGETAAETAEITLPDNVYETLRSGNYYGKIEGLTGEAGSEETAAGDDNALASNAFVENDSKKWQTSWKTFPSGLPGGIRHSEEKYFDVSSVVDYNWFKIKLPSSENRIRYFEYVSRADSGDNTLGTIRTLKVLVKYRGETEYVEPAGAQYDTDGKKLEYWPMEAKKTSLYVFAEDLENVEEIKLVAQTVWTKKDGTGNCHVTAGKLRVYGTEKNTTYGYPITGVVGTADNWEKDSEDNSPLFALDGKNNTLWHTQWDETVVDTTTGKNNNYIITLPRRYNVTALSYRARTDTSNNGKINDCEIYFSYDGGHSWTPQPVARQTGWSYGNSGTQGEEKIIEIPQDGNWTSSQVNAVKITVLKTDADNAANRNKYISAAEFRVYGEPTKLKLKASVQNSDYGSVTVTDAAGNDCNDNAVLYGAQLNLTASPREGYVFSYWKDKVTGVVVSGNANFTHTLTRNEEFEAVFFQRESSENSCTVIYKFPKKFGDGIIGTDFSVNADNDYTVSSGEKAARFGYTFDGWKDVNTGKVYQLGQAIPSSDLTKEVVLEATYKLTNTSKQCFIWKNYLGLSREDSYETLPNDQYNQTYPLTAEMNVTDGEKQMTFKRWEITFDWGGVFKPVSTNPNYKYLIKEIEPWSTNHEAVYLQAVYEEGGVYEAKPIVTIGIKKRHYESAKLQRIRIQLLFDATSDTEVIEKGILTTLNQEKSSNLTLEAVDGTVVKNSRSLDERKSGSLLLNANMKGTSAAATMYCRGYMTYKKADGTIVTDYTDLQEIRGESAPAAQ